MTLTSFIHTCFLLLIKLFSVFASHGDIYNNYDDDDYHSQMLRKNGHHVETCMNGSLGLDRLIMGHRNNDFDVCLCDLQMPVRCRTHHVFFYPSTHDH